MISARKLLFILISIIVVLLILNVLTVFNYEYGSYFFKKFNFDKEKNIPSIFSSLLLLMASATLLFISFKALTFKISNVFWRSLSFIFLFLSFDELLRIHEKIGKFTGNYIKGEGVFYYAWLIPYGVLLLFLIFIYAKPVFALPVKIRINMIISGVLFVGGAVGIEMITGLFIEKNELFALEELRSSMFIFLLYSIEETLEMLGVSYFIYTLFSCIELYEKRKQIDVQFISKKT